MVADYKSSKVPAPRFTKKALFGLWTYAAALAASDLDRVLPDRVELLYLVGRERLSRPVLRPVLLEHATTMARVWRHIVASLRRRNAKTVAAAVERLPAAGEADLADPGRGDGGSE